MKNGIVWEILIYQKKNGFSEFKPNVEGCYFNFEKIDNYQHGIHDYFKFLKYGFGRATDQLNIAIRMNEMTRAQALSIVKKIDGKVDNKNLVDFADYLGIKKDELTAIINSFVNHSIFKKDDKGEFIEIVKRY